MVSGLPSGSPLTVPPERTGPRSKIPATCGAAIEVPLMVLYPPPFQVELMLTPGAQKSTGGLPKLEKEAHALLEFMAETVKIFGPFTLAGEVVLASLLSFPAANTNRMPVEDAAKIASSKACETGPPRLMLATSPALPLALTCSTPAITPL